MRASVYLAITITVLLAFLAACAPAAPTAAPTKPAAPAPTTAAPSGAATAAPKAVPAAVSPTAAPKPAAATATPAAKIKRGGTLRFGLRMEIAPNLDPHQITGMQVTLDSAYDGLTFKVRNEKTGLWEDKPDLAESWDMPNPKTIVMKLRKGVKFQDGSEFNAEVAKWNLDRMMNHPKSAAKNEVLVIDSVDVVDNNTIKINLKGAPAGLLGIMSTNGRAWMASKAAVDKNGDEFLSRNTAGTGPFQFVEWKTGDSISYKRWDGFWDKGADGQPLPYLDGVKYIFRADKTMKAIELRSGALDLIDEVDPKDIPGLKNDPNLTLLESDWSAQVQYFFYNMKKPPFGDNAKLRQAGQYALDRESMAKAVGKGFGYPAYYFWGKGTLGYDETLPKYDYQPDKAKQLVKDAGFPNGLDVTLPLIAREPDLSNAQVMKQMWDAIGIRTTLAPTERTAVVAMYETGGHEVGASSRGWGTSDPDQYSFRLVTDGTFNFAHWENPEMDKCMEEGRNEPADAKRVATYARCQKIMFEEAPYGVSWYYPRTLVYNKSVKGVVPFYSEAASVRTIWFDK